MNLGYVVLYVKDSETAKNFWTNKIGFNLKRSVKIGEKMVYTVGKDGAPTNIELVPKPIVETNEQGINTNTPSLCFNTYDLVAQRNFFIEMNVKVTDIIEYEGVHIFSFFDQDDQAFAMMEV